jgi:hypothetical protein
MSSIENILGGIKNRPAPEQTSPTELNTIIPESGNTGKREIGKSGKKEKPNQTTLTGEYKKFTMMVRKDLVQKIKTLNMKNSNDQDKFIPEYVTLEEIINYYFSKNI